MNVLIFDGHNDVLSKLLKAGGRGAAPGFGTGLNGQLDLPRARSGGFGGGFFAIWARSELPGGGTGDDPEPPYDVALPPELSHDDAWEQTRAQADLLHYMRELGMLRICTSVAQIEETRAGHQIAAILHLEGADGIGPELYELEELYYLGLRSIGPVWSRPNRFGHGVPFRFPSDGETGPGLSAAGKDLIAKCGELRIMVDLSHLNAAGIRDVASISDVPLVATHSNAHAVSPHARNLTDEQLATIARSGGVVGLNFEATFLRPDGRPDADIPESIVMAHLDHLIGALGEGGVALGSDFDGCRPPDWLDSVGKLPTLVAAMERHGYSAERIERICWGNWMRVLRDIWGG